jgi:outer membrane protein assembly factor BamB
MNLILKHFPFLLTYFFIFLETAFAQTLVINSIDAKDFPKIRAKVFAFGMDGRAINTVNPKDISVIEEGNNRRVLSITCPKLIQPKAISSVLTIDVSGSMGSGGPRIDLARKAAKAWIDGLDLGKSECAISSFDDRSYINHDFTSDKVALLSAIRSLKPQGGTDYNAGFINQPGGALVLSREAKNKHVIVFLTDGQGSGNQDLILKSCLEQGVLVYCVTLGMPAPDILKNIAVKSGGEYFENVTSVDDAIAVYQKILSTSQEVEPCELIWDSSPGCSEERTIQIKYMDNTFQYGYKIPSSSIVSLEILPSRLEFGEVNPHSSKDLQTILTARNSSFTILGVKPVFKSSQFSLKDTLSFPFTLQPNQSKSILISFAPKDSGFAFGSFEIQADKCLGNKIFCSGGFKGIKPSLPTLHLISPNGGEVFAAGNDAPISWEGVLPTDSVRIEISTDGGTTWKIVNNNASDLRSNLKIPSAESKKCLARITQIKTQDLFYKSSKTVKSVKYPKPSLSFVARKNFGAAIEGVSSLQFSPDGKYILTACWERGENERNPKYYGKTRLFDADNGDEIKAFSGGYHAIFNPDGSQILSVEDRTLFLWETKSGKLLWQSEFSKSMNAPTDVRFLADGKRIVYVGGWGDSTYILDTKNGKIIAAVPDTKISNDFEFQDFSPDFSHLAFVENKNTIQLFDIINNNKILSIQEKSDQIKKVIFSPDGANLLIISSKGIAKLLDANNGKEMMILEKSGAINGEFTPDGSLIALLYNRGAAIYDAVKGNQIKKFEETDNTSFSAYRMIFSPDGTYLALISIFSLQVWDVQTGNYLATYSRSNAQPIFNPDGYRLACSDARGNVNIYDISGSPIQQDVSDNFWSIVKPHVVSKDVNFGKKIINSSMDSIIQGFLINSGMIKASIDSITISGPNAADFSIVSGVPPFEIEKNISKDVEFRFSPTEVGVRKASIEISLLDGTKIQQSLSGEGIKPLIESNLKLIDFGGVKVGQNLKKTFTSLVKNIGSAPVKIHSISLAGESASQFKISKAFETFSLAPGEAYNMDIEFNPKFVGRTSGSISFGYDGKYPLVVDIIGTGLDTAKIISECSSKLIDMRYSIGINPVYPLAPGLKVEMNWKDFGLFLSGMFLFNAGKYDDPPTASEYDASNYSTNFTAGFIYHFNIGCNFYPFAGVFTGLKTRYWKDNILTGDIVSVKNGSYSDYPFGMVTGAKLFINKNFYIELDLSLGSFGYHERLTGEIKRHEFKVIPWLLVSYMFE